MADFRFSEKEIKDILRRIIINFRDKDTEDQLAKNARNLINSLQSQRQSAGIKMYHSTRFAFIKQGSYFTTKTGKDLKQSGQHIQKIYQQIKIIFQKLEKEIGLNVSNDLNYAIYYQDGKTIKRASMNKIPSVKTSSRAALKTHGLQTFLKNTQNLEEYDIKILDVGEHFQSFIGVIKATYKKGNIPNRVLSYGRLAQAFQMHLQSNLDHNCDSPPWNYNEIWDFVRQATANVPWYLTGDVGGTQVKSIITGDVRLTSKAAFQDTLNFLNYLLNDKDDIEQAVNNAYNILVVQLKQTEQNVIKDLAHQTVSEALQRTDLKGKVR